MEQNVSRVDSMPVNDGNEAKLTDFDINRDLVDFSLFSATNKRNGKKKRKDRLRASRYVHEVVEPVVECPMAEDPPTYDSYPAKHNAAKGSVGFGVRIDDPQADEVVVVVADALESDYAAADHGISSAPPLVGYDVEILEIPADVDDGYSPVPVAEEPHLSPALTERVETGLERSSSVSRPTSPLVPVEESTAELQVSKKYAAVLKIPHGSEVLMTMVCLGSATKTAILKEAEAIYVERVLENEPEGKGWRRKWTRKLLTVTVDGDEVDMTAFASEDLTFLLEQISTSAIPMFTVKISQTLEYWGSKTEAVCG